MKQVYVDDYNQICESNEELKYFEGKTLLLTGGTSFLFSYFAKLLLYNNSYKTAKSTRLIVLVRDIEKANNIYADYLRDKNLVIIKTDIMTKIEYNEKVDIIIHAASQASPKYYGVDPCGTINANVIGTYNLLEFAREKDVKDFLFISSGEVYGIVDVERVTETDYGYIDCNSVRACYSEGKRAGETMCVAYAHQYRINAKIARFYHTYAPDMPLDDGRIFADFARMILCKQDILLNSDGLAVRSFCYVSDAIDGIMKIIVKGEKANAYNVANVNETYSIRQIAERLADVFADRNIKVVIDSKQTVKAGYIQSPIGKAIPSIDKIKQLGWQPIVSIEEGFKKVIASYEEN